jgi:acetyltransferase EpsM
MGDARQIVVVGAGGHATVVIDALIAGGRRPAFVLDDDPSKRGEQIGGITIRGPLAELSEQELQRCSIVVAIAKNDLRRRLVLDLLGRHATLCGVRHPSAIISPQATMDPTTQIMAGAIVNAGATIKAHAVLNTGCIVEHDASVAEHTHIGPGAILAGAAVLEQGVFVATGAKVCPFVRLGSWSTLGAGAVALCDVPTKAVAVGVPARVIQKETRP